MACGNNDTKSFPFRLLYITEPIGANVRFIRNLSDLYVGATKFQVNPCIHIGDKKLLTDRWTWTSIMFVSNAQIHEPQFVNHVEVTFGVVSVMLLITWAA